MAVEQRITAACLANGWGEPLFYETTVEDPGTGQAAQAVRDGVDLVCTLGGDGTVQPMPELREVEDLDGGPGYPVITGDYSAVRPWRRQEVVVGTPVSKPTPVFTKLDPSLVEDELARLGSS